MVVLTEMLPKGRQSISGVTEKVSYIEAFTSQQYWYFLSFVKYHILFHHQIATCTENVKFREVNVDLLPGT